MEPATLNDTIQLVEPLPTGNTPLLDGEAIAAEKDSAAINSSTCVSSEQLMPPDDEQQLPKSPEQSAREETPINADELTDSVPQPPLEQSQPSPKEVESQENTEEPCAEHPPLPAEQDSADQSETTSMEDKSAIESEVSNKPVEKSTDPENSGSNEPIEDPPEPHHLEMAEKAEQGAVLKAEEAAENELIGSTMRVEEKKEPNELPRFDTPEAAVESLPKLPPEPVDEESEEVENFDQAGRRPNKRTRRESGDSLPSMRPRKESRRPSTRDDDTEPEQHTKTKRRKTLPIRQHSSLASNAEADSITEMSLDAVPDGWKQPLLYFVEGRPYDYSKNKWVHELDEENSQSQSSHKSNDRRNIRWLRLGDLLIKTGAIYLSPTDTGTPDTPNHAEGPTAIIRDLCALVQGGASDPVPLHLGAYTALGRANARDHINLKATKWDSGIGVTRVLKAGNEKEVLQLLPLDLIASCLASNLRAMLAHSHLFPAHLFASPMHLLQFGPSIAIHLAVANRGRQLAELIRSFVDSGTRAKLNELEESYNKGVGGTRLAGGRRRMANKAKEHTGLRSYVMSQSDRRELEEIVDALERALAKLRGVALTDTQIYPAEFEGKEFEEGALVFQNLEVPLLSMSSAAMRTKVYEYYGLQPCIIDLWEDALPGKALKEVLKHSVKEDERWLMNGSRRVLMDFTLSEAQEEWILKRGRGEIDLAVPMPASGPSARLMRHLLHHPTEDVSENAHNCILEVALADQPTKQGEEYTVIVSLRTVKRVNSNEKLVLDGGHNLVRWEDMANDESDSDSTSSQT